ncbi:MAG: phosphoribosylformylglycinamidine cyclo-ligase [Candidatus Levybacteria bacterium]|nr:phosphoribosylformylglycinamidine cyclo-ligase [Candidatus Levybacteria bacterium]
MASGKKTYSSTGVRYDILDPIKKLAQQQALSTSQNLFSFGMHEISQSRGESAYVWDEGDSYRALVIEGLGTKNLIADEMERITGKTYYDAIAKDTVAMIVNDLIVVGARPQVVNAYFGVGDSAWFHDTKRAGALINGFAAAVNEARAVWGGGETPALKGIVEKDAIDLSGSAVGIIRPKERLTLGDKITEGDAVFLVESNGVHANGMTLVRSLAQNLKNGYLTKLPDGKSFGEALLSPTHIYAGLINDLFEAGVGIHYMVNVTGHGWRKIMRAHKEVSYVMDHVPNPLPVFSFIQEHSGNDDREMYGNFNMGAGFAIIMPDQFVSQATHIAWKNYHMSAGKAGSVQKGSKKVVIQPVGVEFGTETLDIR